MRAACAGWTGRALNDSNMTLAGEAYAQQVLDLFNRNNTLSEFNSATYTGVSLYALTLWAKYLPASNSSIMGLHAPRMIAAIWTTVGELYNANLRNIAGPWDRSYGFDQNLYDGIMGIYIGSLIGAANAPNINTVSRGGRTPAWATNHADDFEIAPLLSVLLPYHNALVPADVQAKLRAFPGEHIYQTAAFAPPHDHVPRNTTTWLAANVTIGAESFDMDVVGGFSINPPNWAPAVAQWLRADGSVGWFSWYATEAAMDVHVQAGFLRLAYPKGSASSVFTFVVATNPLGQKRDVQGWADVWGLAVNVSGTVDLTPQVSFCGLLGGACSPINDFEFWNFTYTLPPGSTETPTIAFTVEVVQ